MPATFAFFLAQATNAAGVPATDTPYDSSSAGSGWSLFMFPVMLALLYFAFLRPQSQAKKKQEELVKTAKTGDRVVTTGGIHGVISNAKDSTVILKIADNVKIEIEKSHIDKVLRDSADSDKTTATKS